MKKTINLISALCLCFYISTAQLSVVFRDTSPSSEGVDFIQGLSWKEVKEKAKKENKFIFLDVFATWCGPCKQMDKKVYLDPMVGKFLNNHFISVKVQTDQTKDDSEMTKRWYPDAKTISQQYHVLTLPTYLYFFPDGSLCYRDGGYKLPIDFLQICQKALSAEQVYVDPNTDFYEKAVAYKKGNKDDSDLIGLRKKAIELGDAELVSLLDKDILVYLKSLSKTQLYNKDYLEFIAQFQISSASRFFSLFFPNADRANAIVNQQGFAERVVNKTIMQEKVWPFYKRSGFTPRRYTTTGILNGRFEKNATVDWNKLRRLIKRDFGRVYAARNTLTAKVHWFYAKNEYIEAFENYFQLLNKFGMDTIDKSSMIYPGAINDNCWFIFENIFGKKILDQAVRWMNKALKTNEGDYRWLDTYANLLHKAGKTKQAIPIEKKAIEIAKAHPEWLYTKESAEEMEALVKKMEQGLPTWRVPAEILIPKKQ